MSSDSTVVGDLHLTPKSIDRAKKLFEIVEALGNPVIWLGDLLDLKEIVRSSCLNALYFYLKTSKLTHVVLIGNHDWQNLQCLDHSLQLLKELPNVLVVDHLRCEGNIYFVPYIHDKLKLKEILKQIPDGSIVFGHFDVFNFDFGNGHLCEDQTITLEDFSRFKKVISGHFHKYQVSGNFTFLGTPFSKDHGETNQVKFLGIYNHSTTQLELIESIFPKHVTLKLELQQNGSKKTLDDYVAENQNNFMRIQLYGSPEIVSAFNDKYRPLYEDKYSIKFEDKSIASFDSSANLDEMLDNKSQFMSWSRDIKKLDPETVTLGLSILEALLGKRN